VVSCAGASVLYTCTFLFPSFSCSPVLTRPAPSRLCLPPRRRPGAPKGSKGAQAYMRVSEEEIADDYPAPQVRFPCSRCPPACPFALCLLAALLLLKLPRPFLPRPFICLVSPATP
jgi:hypothetical protein